MKELSKRQAKKNREYRQKSVELTQRVDKLTPESAQQLLTELKKTPKDGESYFTLVRYYEKRVDIKHLNDLKLWYIEHYPDGPIRPGNINPRHDRRSYEKGRMLWTAHVKKHPNSFEICSRAADFLGGGHKAEGEAILLRGRTARPSDPRWISALARHYAHTLHGATEPFTEYNVFRTTSAVEAQSDYALDVRARLLRSTDAPLLAHTAREVLMRMQIASQSGVDGLPLASMLIERAAALDPESPSVKQMKDFLKVIHNETEVLRLKKLPPEQLDKLVDADRMLYALGWMRQHWAEQQVDLAEKQASDVITYSKRVTTDAYAGAASFEAKMVLGKVAFRRGDIKGAKRNLLAAAEVPVLPLFLRMRTDMNLSRALVDAGERTTVAQFLETLSTKAPAGKQYADWAAQIRNGFNPDLTPTFSFPACSNDPC